MSKEKILGVDLDIFLKNHDLLRIEFENTGLEVDELTAIANDHDGKKTKLTQVASFVSNMLQPVTEVHSIKSRLKSLDGLVTKIIQKRIESPERIINLANYEKEITDLIGVRALHLFKYQWKPILDFAKSQGTEVERPVAYHRSGDAEEVLKAFRDAGLRTEVRSAGYRSVHLVISCGMGLKTHPVEIQIRTVFEEAWAEIDHIVRYPRKTENPELAGFLKLFNSFAGTADDMGTYLMTLRAWLSDHNDSVKRERERADSLEVQVAQLKISEGQKKALQGEIAALRQAATVAAPPVFVSTNTSPFLYSAGTSLADMMKASGANIADTIKVSSASSSIAEMIKASSGSIVADSLKGSSLSVAGSLSITKSCPSGHVFSVPANSGQVTLGVHTCPTCKAVVY
jgi:putative GTP pyrophosphokinase